MISYAQNFEDVMLWRALKHVKNGFYVDVGAGDPVNDSVTKWFYEQGWSGINIEPNDEDFEALSKERNRDTNLKLAVGPHQGLAKFFLNKTKGWSTMNAKTAKAAKALGSPSEIIEVESMPLRKILENKNPSEIHFMKIDVEGYEKQVLESADFEKYRPWIIVVEFADLKGNYGDPVMAFPILKKKDYKPVLFDGLNVYYVAQERSELGAFFKTPASVFDEYTLYKYSREMESLRAQFVSSEKDREARLKVIEEQGKRVVELDGEVRRRLEELKGLYEERDKLGQQSQALALELESLRSQFVSSEKDREARLKVIEDQGKRVVELEGEVHRRLEELKVLYNEQYRLAKQSHAFGKKIGILEAQFSNSEKDREARLKVIEDQGKRVVELEGEVHRRLEELKGLYEERDKLGQQSQALALELESLRSQFVSSEKDREARGRVIEDQGKRVVELEEKILHQKEELIKTSQKLTQIISLFAKVKIILIAANPLVAFVCRPLIKNLEAKLVEAKKVLRLS